MKQHIAESNDSANGWWMRVGLNRRWSFHHLVLTGECVKHTSPGKFCQLRGRELLREAAIKRVKLMREHRRGERGVGWRGGAEQSRDLAEGCNPYPSIHSRSSSKDPVVEVDLYHRTPNSWMADSRLTIVWQACSASNGPKTARLPSSGVAAPRSLADVAS